MPAADPTDSRSEFERTIRIGLRLSDDEVRRIAAEVVSLLLSQVGRFDVSASPYLTVEEAAA